jgi:hypothetical protein
MAKAPLKEITLHTADVTDHGQYRDAGSALKVGTDISAERAQALIDGHRAVDAAATSNSDPE